MSDRDTYVDQILAEKFADAMDRHLDLPDDQDELEAPPCLDPTGHYVYAWFDYDRIVYIGRGSTSTRFKRRHRSQLCQLVRDNSDKFRIEILDGLSESGAKVLEGAMIRLLKPIGNVSKGRSLRRSGWTYLEAAYADLRAALDAKLETPSSGG